MPFYSHVMSAKAHVFVLLAAPCKASDRLCILCSHYACTTTKADWMAKASVRKEQSSSAACAVIIWCACNFVCHFTTYGGTGAGQGALGFSVQPNYADTMQQARHRHDRMFPTITNTHLYQHLLMPDAPSQAHAFCECVHTYVLARWRQDEHMF